jgi:capsular polysaccharide biosynthesis protein
VFELLPKLRGVETYRRETNLRPKIIVSSDPPSFVYDSLSFFGYDESDVIEWESDALRVNRLVVPTYPDLLPGNINWLRNSVLDAAEESDEFDDERVFISRQKAAYRRVENYNEVIDLLSAYGFEPYVLEEMSFERQVALFNNAEIIVGPHGAGFSNIIWAEDPVIIEMFNDYVTPTFTVIANHLGFDHEPFRCEAASVGDSDANLIVDADALEAALSQYT